MGLRWKGAAGVPALVLLVAAACSDRPTAGVDEPGRQAVSLKVGLAAGGASVPGADSAVVRVSGAGMDDLHETLSITGDGVEGRIEGIPVGENRLFEVFVYSAQGTLAYYGSGAASVLPGTTVTLSIDIGPATGAVALDGTIHQGPPSGDEPPPTAAALVACYPFNESAADASGNGYDGAVRGATFVTDRFGDPHAALLFDGVDDKCMVGTFSISLPLTVSCWFRSSRVNDVWDTLIGWNSPVDPHPGVQIAARGDGRLRVRLGDFYTDVETHAAVDGDDAWHFIAATRSGHEIRVYIDGVLDAWGTSTVDIGQHHALYFGDSFRPEEYEEYWEGYLDDVRFHAGALTAGQIRDLYGERDWEQR
ncbi:MAG: LamG domain-containing protein [Candidatus Latescibacterota bacterium]